MINSYDQPHEVEKKNPKISKISFALSIGTFLVYGIIIGILTLSINTLIPPGLIWMIWATSCGLLPLSLITAIILGIIGLTGTGCKKTLSIIGLVLNIFSLYPLFVMTLFFVFASLDY